MNLLSYLADAVVVLHGMYVAFVVVGLLAIVCGFVCKWRWVRNRWFRNIHLAMIMIVAIEALVGITCPLTTLENYLRRQAGSSVRDELLLGSWFTIGCSMTPNHGFSQSPTHYLL